MSHVPLLWRYVIHEIDQLSSLSDSEYVKFVGHYNFLASGQDKSNAAVENRGYPKEVLEEMRQRARETFSPVESCGLRFSRPFDGFKSDLLRYGLTLFENYERGLLPFPGPVSEQPAQIMEIFGVLKILQAEQEEKARKKLNRNVERLSQNQHRGSR